MSIKLNTPPIAVKMTKQELNEFSIYLKNCSEQGFSGINFFKHQVEREMFMKWHLRELFTRVINKLMKLHHDSHSKKLTFQIYEPEQRTLSHMFKRVDCNPYFLQMQPRFLHELTPIDLRKW